MTGSTKKQASGSQVMALNSRWSIAHNLGDPDGNVAIITAHTIPYPDVESSDMRFCVIFRDVPRVVAEVVIEAHNRVEGKHVPQTTAQPR